MAAPIPPKLKYSIVLNVLNSPPILIMFVSKFMVCKALYFEVQYVLKLRSPLRMHLQSICFVFNYVAVLVNLLLNIKLGHAFVYNIHKIT